MDDTFKTVTLGLLTLLLLNGGLEQRAKRGAERQVRDSFTSAGTVHVRMVPHGVFGLVMSDLSSVDVYGSNLKSDRLPFFVYPGPDGSWKGRIHHIRLHLTNLTLAGVPVRKFDADIPATSFDISHAITRNYLVLRSAGVGPAFVEIGAEGLQIFIERKFSRLLSQVDISFKDGSVLIDGKARLFGSENRLISSGRLVAREGRYLDLVDPDIRMNGMQMNASGTASLLKQINPVLDAETDLGLGGYFYMERVEIGSDSLIVYGRATIPSFGTKSPKFP